MKYLLAPAVCFLSLISFFQNSSAQDSISAYNKNQVFDPSFLSLDATEFRSADGAPGPKYWQNSASYLIHSTLNEKDTTLKGDVTIRYTNNSPDELTYL